MDSPSAELVLGYLGIRTIEHVSIQSIQVNKNNFESSHAGTKAASLGIAAPPEDPRRRPSLNPAAVGAEFILEKRKYGENLRDRLLGS